MTIVPKIHRTFVLVLVSALAMVAACSGPREQDACPVPPQRGCPSDALTFTTGIADLLHTRCFPCHSADGVEQSHQLTDYDHVKGERMSIASQVASCSMPPAGSPELTSEERQQIIDWYTCGTPE
jgi:uncharacterized membrane protein